MFDDHEAFWEYDVNQDSIIHFFKYQEHLKVTFLLEFIIFMTLKQHKNGACLSLVLTCSNPCFTYQKNQHPTINIYLL